ncbi:succinate dehydrogenase, hydrophobic membrane anchor protein [uncultured Sphingomonas sp.]|jgi:succinate dehydrogenase / fumarate reductase membrane anchor subunit|uniref:succinate dehydrogenase, hydrophobic membrane anchor protein n=1 Tax=unclassified Sphingomonas TaxID=196159 RepID=UPI0025F92670|nr:succinate dehydrogenase, hydrophobic membrane anchor protein [uncultured Sphingomonas sp.]
MGTGTSIGRVRGLGSAHEGAHHWWHQKITAGSNILLMSWLMISLARRPAYDFGTMREWMSSAWVAIPMMLLVISVFYHFRIGLQVVIEDYQRHERRVAAMVVLNLFVAAIAGTAIFAILKIAFGAN